MSTALIRGMKSLSLRKQVTRFQRMQQFMAKILAGSEEYCVGAQVFRTKNVMRPQSAWHGNATYSQRTSSIYGSKMPQQNNQRINNRGQRQRIKFFITTSLIQQDRVIIRITAFLMGISVVSNPCNEYIACASKIKVRRNRANRIQISCQCEGSEWPRVLYIELTLRRCRSITIIRIISFYDGGNTFLIMSHFRVMCSFMIQLQVIHKYGSKSEIVKC